jgi:predicted metalloprotease with PDZ domain
MLLPTIALVATAVSLGAEAAAPSQPLRYSVDLADTVHHVFHVTLTVSALSAKNDVFEFAATAPGTYQTMDVGRFVRGFGALDAAGHVVPVERIGINEWRFADPSRVHEIHYGVIATRDTVVAENRVYAMCGTRLVSDYALINGQGVFGFPRGMQSSALQVDIKRPSGWTMGTSLRSEAGALVADSYDQLVDSPILLGSHLTTATLDVTGVPVTIIVQSKKDQIHATQLRDAMRDMLNSAGAFLGKLPVDRYTFLYDFGPGAAGAWEHSYGSEYVLQEAPYTPAVGAGVTDVAAHEFFHVVTPLNIHSEIIEHFNFATPTPSQHLWLYEGTTEWAAHKMQLEAGLKTLPAYLATVVQKERADRVAYDTTFSLTELSLTSYSDSGQAQYANIYQRGAVVAGLLDIRLLELSGGKRGLRVLILDLSKQYGKQRAFPEAGLLDTIVARTSPEIGDFFNRYIRGSERPPLREYYAKIGIRLVDDPNGLPLRLELDPNATPAQVKLREAWMGKKARIV